MVLNLLSNAVKFTPDGGSVTVEARRVGDEAQVSVRDTGIGIAEAEQERIFEAFQRGGRTARTSTEGTGLGLTLSKRIVDLHGGRLWMESELGVGSTFSFAIPLIAALGAAAEPVAEAETADRDRGSVLVVEDDRPLGRAAARLPRQRGLRRRDRPRRHRGPRAGPAAWRRPR